MDADLVALHAKHGPVFWWRLLGRRLLMVGSYEAVMTLLKGEYSIGENFIQISCPTRSVQRNAAPKSRESAAWVGSRGAAPCLPCSFARPPACCPAASLPARLPACHVQRICLWHLPASRQQGTPAVCLRCRLDYVHPAPTSLLLLVLDRPPAVEADHPPSVKALIGPEGLSNVTGKTHMRIK